MNSLNYSPMGAVILVSLTLGCIGQTKEVTEFPTTLEITSTLSGDVSILEIAQKTLEVREFVTENPDFGYTITALVPENITKLAEKYPVVYGDLPRKTLYRVDYVYGSYGILVIVDMENKNVLKYFRSLGINLS